MSEMTLSKGRPPQHSRKKLSASLKILSSIKDQHPRWVNLAMEKLSAQSALYPHPVYHIRWNDLLAGQPFQATVKRTGWIYFLRDRANRVASAEVTVISGRHKNVRVSEGAFVRKLFGRIAKLKDDRRIGRRRFYLKSIRVEAVHLFCLWLEVGSEDEYFIPITNSTAFTARKWLSREQFTQLLRSEGQRIRDAQAKMRSLLEAYQ